MHGRCAALPPEAGSQAAPQGGVVGGEREAVRGEGKGVQGVEEQVGGADGGGEEGGGENGGSGGPTGGEGR